MNRISIRNRMLAVTAAMLLCITGCSKPAPRPANEIIEEIITYHGCYGDEADVKVQELLGELTTIDAREAKLWTDIMNYWHYANEELQVNVDTLPDDLPDGNNLVLAVLGFELNDDGTMQDELVSRLTVALHCAEQYPNAYVLCTGGGTAKNNPDVTEGGLMGAWMLEHGLDERRLIVEDQSHTTAENASNSYDILLRDYPQVDSVALISSNYHIAWGSLLFESAFMKTASEQQTPEIHVISNCSCAVQERHPYLWEEILRWEICQQSSKSKMLQKNSRYSTGARDCAAASGICSRATTRPSAPWTISPCPSGRARSSAISDRTAPANPPPSR